MAAGRKGKPDVKIAAINETIIKHGILNFFVEHSRAIEYNAISLVSFGFSIM